MLIICVSTEEAVHTYSRAVTQIQYNWWTLHKTLILVLCWSFFMSTEGNLLGNLPDNLLIMFPPISRPESVKYHSRYFWPEVRGCCLCRQLFGCHENLPHFPNVILVKEKFGSSVLNCEVTGDLLTFSEELLEDSPLFILKVQYVRFGRLLNVYPYRGHHITRPQWLHFSSIYNYGPATQLKEKLWWNILQCRHTSRTKGTNSFFLFP